MDLGVWVGLAATVAAIVAATAWTERTAFLHLSIFRPYRGETWPLGVQEEYDVHWNVGGASRPDPERPEPVGTTLVSRPAIGRPQRRR